MASDRSLPSFAVPLRNDNHSFSLSLVRLGGQLPISNGTFSSAEKKAVICPGFMHCFGSFLLQAMFLSAFKGQNMKLTVKILFTFVFYVVTPVPAVVKTVCKYSSRFLSRISYLSSYVFLRRRRSFTLRKLYVCLETMFLAAIPGGGTPWNFWWGCAVRISKSRPNFRPKNAISHTRFQTWPQKSIPVFRPDLVSD